MEQEFNRQTLFRLILGSFVWGGVLLVALLGVDRLGVHAMWLLLPLSCLLATLVMYVARIPNLYQGALEREPRFGRWLAQQLATWGLLCIVLWLFRF